MPLLLHRAVLTLLIGAFALALVAGTGPILPIAAVVALTIYLWATLPVPVYYTSLLFMALVLVFGLVSPEIALAGFKSQAVWLVFTGIVFAAAIQQHQMGGALFDRLLGKLSSYRTLIWTIAVFGLVLAFVIPSATGRVVVVAPLVIALCDRLGLAADARERIGIYLLAVVGTTLPAFTILTSNVPNIVMLGAMETAYGKSISYGDYFILNFPVLGIGMFLLLPILVLRLFPGSIEPRSEPAKTEPWNESQKTLSMTLIVTLTFWATDNLHGIAAAWIGLAAALIVMAPKIGVIAPSSVTKLNFGPWLFVAGAISLGATVQNSGLGLALWDKVPVDASLENLPDFVQYFILVLVNMVLGVFATLPASPSIFTPLAASIAETIGWQTDGVILSQIPSFVIFPFPYQAPPILVGLTMLAIPMRDAMGLFLRVYLAGLLILVPLHYIWGRILGYFG